MFHDGIKASSGTHVICHAGKGLLFITLSHFQEFHIRLIIFVLFLISPLLLTKDNL